MESCIICLEDLVRGVGINCPQCSSKLHSKCAQQHLLNSVLDAHCPNCNKTWTRDFLAEYLSKSWLLGAYKTHLENVLLDRQKALLPTTQDAAARELQSRRNTIERRRLTDQLRAVEIEYHQAGIRHRKLRAAEGKKPSQEVKDALREKTAIRDRMYAVRRQRNSVGHVHLAIPMYDAFGIRIETQASAPAERREFIHPCPAPDCRGFLSSAWKCKLCQADTCCKCGDLKADDDHAPSVESRS